MEIIPFSHKFILGCLLFTVTSCYVGDDIPPDQSIWEYDLPRNQNLEQDGLLNINSSIRLREYEVIEGLIIIKNNKLVFENYYFNGASRGFIKNISDAGLTVTLAALGIAEDKRLLSLDDPITNYLPEYASIFQAVPSKSDITIRHLLTFQSGLSWNETIKGATSLDNNLNQMKRSNDWVAFVLNQPLEAPPGARYSFNTANGVLLAKIIENASGSSFDEFIEHNLTSLITIKSLTVEQDSSGNFNGGDGYAISLIDWAKLATLFIQEGLWEGRKIIDPNFIQESTTSQVQISSFDEIGYFWNLFGDDFENGLGVDHRDVYYTLGGEGQSLFIVPSENLIVAILADNFFGFNFESLNLFIDISFTIQTTQ